MFAAAPTDAPPTDPAATARGLIEGQLAMLQRLAEIGMEVAEAAGRRARALADEGGAKVGAASEAGVDPGLTFSRAARAVRLTLALQSRLVESLAALDRAEAVARVGEAARRRRRIHERIEEAAEAEGCDAAEVERLSSGVWERLTEEDDDDLLDRPAHEIVALICRDLGLSPAFAAQTFAAQTFPAPTFAAPPDPGPERSAPGDPPPPPPPLRLHAAALARPVAPDRPPAWSGAPPARAAPPGAARLDRDIAQRNP